MNFYIKEIKLWFNGNFEPKSYFLEPNKINVITGTATKGKTSFLSIIDYCLLAPYSKLVETIINENVSWYGICFFKDDKYYCIARKAPKNGVISPELYFVQGNILNNKMPIANTELGDLLNILNKIWGITEDIQNLSKQRIKDKRQISFRSFLPYCIITENIITIEEQFYDTSYFQDTISIKDSFPFALGLNSMYIQSTKRRLFLKAEIKRMERQKNNIITKQKEYRTKLEKIYINALQNGLLESSETEVATLTNDYIFNILGTISKRFSMLADNSKIIRERETFEKERWRVKKEIDDCTKCIEEYNTYIQNLKQSTDSLEPIEYLYENKEELIQSIETIRFIDALQQSLKKIKVAINIPQKPSNDVYNRINVLQKKIKEIETEIKSRSQVKNEYAKFSDIFKLVGKIETDLEYAKKELPEPFSSEGILQQYTSELERTSQIPSIEILLNNLKLDLEKDIQYIYDQFKTMGEYNNYIVDFDIERYVLKIKEPQTIFPKETIGSQSNYMFLHIAYFLGLQKFSLMRNDSLIPTFIFIDQPSKPYLFTDNTSKDDSDRQKLYEVYYIMNNFVKWATEDRKKKFQIFMIEHTDPTFWEGNDELDCFHTVATFFNNDGLIPNYVIEQ